MSDRAENQRPAPARKSLPTDGPFRFALALSAAGIVIILLGSVTIVPWIKDERQRETIRSIWLALSRNLPDIGFPAVEKIGFWLIVGLVAFLSVALLVLASAVRDVDGPDAESRA